MAGTIRKHFIFEGRVQGVGFRWHACSIASQLGLTGWVRNLDDGTVEMEVQGNDLYISQLIDSLEQLPHVMIENMRISSLALDPHEGGFSRKGW